MVGMFVRDGVSISVRSVDCLEIAIEVEHNVLSPNPILPESSVSPTRSSVHPIVSRFRGSAVIDDRYLRESVLTICGVREYLTAVLEGCPNLLELCVRSIEPHRNAKLEFAISKC